MSHVIKATWYGKDGIEACFGGSFQSLAEGAEHIEQRASVRPNCRIWIDEREVAVRNGRVLGPDGKPNWLDGGIPRELPETATVYLEEINALLCGKSRAPSVSRPPEEVIL